MKRLFLFFLSVFTFLSVSAQVWIDNGAVWHHEFWQPFITGYIEMWYDRDTLIDGINCQVIERTDYKFYDGGDWTDESERPMQITYVSGDTVFYRRNETFFVLFDFSAEIGDSWVVATDPSEDYPDCDEISVVEVIDTGTVEINGTEYRYLDIQPTSNSPYGLLGRYVERFGLISTGLERFRYQFPSEYECAGIPDDVPTEFGYSGFLCFEDDSFELYNPTDNSCTKVVSVFEEERVIVSLYPNPATDYLEVTAPSQINEIYIYNSAGKQMKYEIINANYAWLDLSNLSAGFYVIDVKTQSGENEKSTFIIQ